MELDLINNTLARIKAEIPESVKDFCNSSVEYLGRLFTQVKRQAEAHPILAIALVNIPLYYIAELISKYLAKPIFKCIPGVCSFRRELTLVTKAILIVAANIGLFMLLQPTLVAASLAVISTVLVVWTVSEFWPGI